jgi:hypothetical protein
MRKTSRGGVGCKGQAHGPTFLPLLFLYLDVARTSVQPQWSEVRDGILGSTHGTLVGFWVFTS